MTAVAVRTVDGPSGRFLQEFFFALSDENRLRILYTLRERGGMCVNDISAAIERDQGLTAYHVGYLWKRGFLTRKKRGRFSIYAIRNDRITDLLDHADQVREMLESSRPSPTTWRRARRRRTG
ncbi:MAG TPA: helix-turn-helix transcriptional regulator [Methanoregulaceae archaeon]|nr:helix-turn-helix transcriptional regulator [Methanoregulaceae archaeon]